MYEQVSHSLLNQILDNLEFEEADLRHFYTRLGANFYAIYSLFHDLYGKRDDFGEQMLRLVDVLAKRYIDRPEKLKQTDMRRENNHNWFLSQEWVAMAAYADGFAGDLKGLKSKLPYLHELGVNMLHLMPMLKCPLGESDGGYAVSDYRAIDERLGSIKDLREIATQLHQMGALMVLDVVVNHTSDQHEWAQKAKQGFAKYQHYYYTFPDRSVPDMFEQTMPEIFPEQAPGSFTWNEDMQRWVMTVFNNYQWDLNYTNPAVFIEMVDVILYWANTGADIIRLDAVAFLWKKIGTTCQNEHEAHLLLQLMKDCCQVTAPGTLFIAEAIVAPVEIIKYFGEDAVIAKECEIAYNATFMALLWDAVATRNTKLLNQSIYNLPNKLDRATWLNYARCHDDIGLGYDDNDIRAAGYEPFSHRNFLIEYFTGEYAASGARGKPFGRNKKTGDARISGSLASLAGLETALEQNDEEAIDIAVSKILLLHGLIMSFGGIPLLYYGDEIGTLNDTSYLEDERKANDNRWIHRPTIDWKKAERRHQHGTHEQKIFEGIQKMIAMRKHIEAFADFNNRELVQTDNPHLFAFWRTSVNFNRNNILVVANFDATPQSMDIAELSRRSQFDWSSVSDLLTGEAPAHFSNSLVIPAYRQYWLSDQGVIG